MAFGTGARRRFLFRLSAVLLGLMPFVLLEGGLRLFDLGRPGDSSDPLSGFNRNFPLFERQGAVYRTAYGREPFFSTQEFSVSKPPNAFRMFCFGGSTVYGHPYQSATAFPAWLELELAGGDRTRAYQAVNCGGVSYASYRLAPIVREVLAYQPDLVILATGENEFLEDRTYQSLKSRPAAWARFQDTAFSLRIFNVARNWMRALSQSNSGPRSGASGRTQLPHEVKPRLDDPSGYASYHRDDAWQDRVAAQFEDSARAMVSMCRDAKVPVILVKLGSNLRDCPPFKSEHSGGLSPADEAAWQGDFEAATVAESSDLKKALAVYLKAEALDGEYALLSFRIARVLDRLGRKTEALEYYLKARDQDVCPLRLIKRHEEILSRIAAEKKVPLVDAASLLASRSSDHIPGNDWYLDHVHPTIGGHQKIAQAIAAQLQGAGLAPRFEPWPEEKRRAAYASHLDRLGPAYFADGRRRVEWLEHWSRRERLYDETVPGDAQGFLRLGFQRLELGDDAGAWDALGEALKRDARMTELIRQHGQELVSQGREEFARWITKHF